MVTEAREGDVAVYDRCIDPDCPNRLPDSEHAHLVEVRHATKEETE